MRIKSFIFSMVAVACTALSLISCEQEPYESTFNRYVAAGGLYAQTLNVGGVLSATDSTYTLDFPEVERMVAKILLPIYKEKVPQETLEKVTKQFENPKIQEAINELRTRQTVITDSMHSQGARGIFVVRCGWKTPKPDGVCEKEYKQVCMKYLVSSGMKTQMDIIAKKISENLRNSKDEKDRACADKVYEMYQENGPTWLANSFRYAGMPSGYLKMLVDLTESNDYTPIADIAPEIEKTIIELTEDK